MAAAARRSCAVRPHRRPGRRTASIVVRGSSEALDRRSRVLLKHLGAGEALVVFRDRRQHLRELPGLAIGLELFERYGIASLVDVALEQSVSSTAYNR